jgi:hypothetical protein
MAGAVKGEVLVYADGTLEVQPETCPVEDPHRVHSPVCYRTYPDGEQRACPFWTACTSPAITTERIHPTALRIRAVALGARRVSAQVLCQRQRANRPPGC